MSGSAKREMYLRSRTHTLELFCGDFDMSINPLNRGYQLRVENLVDFYPVNGRYCILQSGERGDWETAQDLRKVMLKATDQPSKNLIDNWAGADTITIPARDTHRLEVLTGVKTMDVADYNKWYRRLWRLLWRRK